MQTATTYNSLSKSYRYTAVIKQKKQDTRVHTIISLYKVQRQAKLIYGNKISTVVNCCGNLGG